MKIIKILLVSILCFCAITHAAQPLPIDQAFNFSASTKDYQTIVLRWQIAPGYYLYRKQFKISVIKPTGLKLPPPVLPLNFDAKKIPSVGTINVYSGNIFIIQPVLSTKQELVTLHVHYQGCSSGGFCYPPVTKAVTVNMQSGYGKKTQGVNVNTPINTEDIQAHQPTTQPPQSRIEKLLTQQRGWQTIIGFFIFGMLIAFTPCVLPMVPILSGIIVGQGKISHTRSFLLSLAYVLGMAITYAIAGVLFGYIGGSLQAAFQKPWLIILFTLIFIAMALSLFDLYDIRLPASLQSKLAKAGQHQNHSKLIGVFLMGVFSTLVLSPCVTAPLVAVLAYISQSGNAGIGGIALFSMGLGMGAPLLLIGAFGPKLLPHTGQWMIAIKHFLGVLLLAIAIWMLARLLPPQIIMLLWAALIIGCGISLGALTTSQGHWQHTKKAIGIILFIYGIIIGIGAWFGNTDPLQPLQQGPAATNNAKLKFTTVKSIDDVYAQLKRKKNKGRPVLLDFYAKWCVACHEMDRRTFNQPKTIEALKNYVLLRADITKNDMTDKLLMQHFHVVAPPTIIFYNAKHQQAKQAIVGFVDADTLLKRLSD